MLPRSELIKKHTFDSGIGDTPRLSDDVLIFLESTGVPAPQIAWRISDENYSILFLHTRSGADPIRLGIRDDRFRCAFRFKRKVLDKAVHGRLYLEMKKVYIPRINSPGSR